MSANAIAEWSHMPGLGAVLCADGRVLASTQDWQRVFGTQAWTTLLDSDGQEGLRQRLQGTQGFCLRLQGGSPQWEQAIWQCDAWPLDGEDAHACLWTDLSELDTEVRKQRDTAGYILTIFEQLPFMVAYFGPKPDAVCLFANQRFATFHGKQVEQIVGRKAIDALGTEWVKQLRRSASAYIHSNQDTTYVWRTRDNLQQPHMLEVSIAGDRWPDGSERGTYLVMTDVTERERAQAALSASQARLASFLDASAEGVIFQRDGMVYDVNPAACRLLNAPDVTALQGRSVLSFVSPSFVERARNVIAAGADAFYETELVDITGQPVPVELIGRSMEHHGERLRMTVVRDIRDRRAAQARIQALIDDLRSQKERAEAADRAKSVFLAAASHDLRQPIHAIGLFLSTVRTMVVTENVPLNVLGDICQRMQSSLDGLGKLLRMLLDVSRLDANAVQVEFGPTSLAQLFTELDQEFADLAREKGLRLHVCSSSAWVHTDAAVLRRILSNLMANAIRYTQRGRILLGARARPRHIEIQVWDTGIGIPSDQLEVIFEEFYQVGHSRASREETHGLGLGLSIVKRSAKLLHAPLQVQSTIGRGSMFAITLARCEPAPAPSAPERAPHAGSTASAPGAPGSRRVLVIDDEEQVLQGMRQLLQVWGHQVWCAASADEAVVLAIEHGGDIDLLITDYRLGAGSTAVQAIAAVHACLPAPVPTYILTGDTSPERIQEASELGYPLLHKPIDSAALQRALSIQP